MSFRFQRRYTGRLKAAILDWAGTVVDHGCLAPAATFIEAFAGFGVPVTVAEARAPMGMAKKDHIRAIAATPRVAAAWIEHHGRPASETDIDALYDRFLPLQVAMVERHAELIPGALAAIEQMRARGLKIGSTTGYPRAVMDVVVREAARQGYVPDAIVVAEDTPAGRPGPFPAWQSLIAMQVSPAVAVVKIGDTVVDIEEGLNGGMWTIGITVTGNEVGLSVADWQVLDPAGQDQRRAVAADRLARAGAHYLCDRLADVGPILEAIDARLAPGEAP